MVYTFLQDISKVKVFYLRTVFVLVLATRCVGAFPLDFGHQDTRSAFCRTCNNEYSALSKSIEMKFKQGSDRHLCAVCKQFLRCIQPLEYKCRPDLNFQAGRSMIMSHMKKYRCDAMNLTWNETVDIISGLKAEIVLQTDGEKCHQRRPKFRPNYKICGLFGDPHLRTFDDKRHTCSVPGAWPLFANRLLTVQVTNIPLDSSTRATATSKVTVIVGAFKQKCIQQKTYQARSFSLPGVFSDGTKTSDDNKDCPTRVLEIAKGRVVRLDICPLKTKIIIRQVGKYLTVHMRVPEDLMRRQTFGLCQRGCPRIEQMNLDKTKRVNNAIASLYAKDSLSKKVKRERLKRAYKRCRRAKVTGFYYKSCMFDLLTSGDPSFAKAARTAMKDFRKINKDELGRPIVNVTARDLYSGPPKGLEILSTTPSAASRTRQKNPLLLFLTLVLVTKAIS